MISHQDYLKTDKKNIPPHGLGEYPSSQIGPTPRVWWGPASLYGPTKVDCHRPHPVRQKMYNASQWTDIWIYAWEYVFSTGIVSHIFSSYSFGTYLFSDAFVHYVYSFVWLFSSCTMCLRRCIHQNSTSLPPRIFYLLTCLH